MGDAMCGPSNALQQFKQQTDRDRTLQQDRISSRQHPAQGFRSHNAKPGILDPQFEAFQAGLDTPPALDHPSPFQQHQQLGFPGPEQAPSWASDFQRLQISPSPMMPQAQFPQHQQQQLHPQAPFQQGVGANNWAQGFRDHIAQAAPSRSQNNSPSPLAFQQRARYGLSGFQPSFAQQQPAFVPAAAQSKGKEPAFDQFDEAAFDRAFDQAREDMMADIETGGVPVHAETSQTSHAQEAKDPVDIHETRVRGPEWESHPMMHGNDVEFSLDAAEQAEQPVQEEPERTQQADDDALSATAHELLEKIRHNTSEKFKNSQFLGLMRKLRDKEVRVEGDRMVETANASSTASSAVHTQLNGASMPAHLPHQVGQTSQFPTASTTIPAHEQDLDAGRGVTNSNDSPRRDGQDVVDLLNQPGGPLSDDSGMSVALPDFSHQDDVTTNLSDILYGANGTLSFTP